MKKILFVGENYVKYEVIQKGVDTFSRTQYEGFYPEIEKVFNQLDVEATHMNCERIPYDFPKTAQELAKYDVVMVSDVGASTFLLHPDTVKHCKRTPNLLHVIEEYVAAGGGFIMIGGYMTFSGIGAKGKYYNTCIEDILPVNILPYDDRLETPEGCTLRPEASTHPILKGIPAEMPYVLGYNKTTIKDAATLVVSAGKDPLIATTSYGKGRTAVFTADCVPHWAPPELFEWEFYPRLWGNIIDWLSGE